MHVRGYLLSDDPASRVAALLARVTPARPNRLHATRSYVEATMACIAERQLLFELAVREQDATKVTLRNGHLRRSTPTGKDPTVLTVLGQTGWP